MLDMNKKLSILRKLSSASGDSRSKRMMSKLGLPDEEGSVTIIKEEGAPADEDKSMPMMAALDEGKEDSGMMDMQADEDTEEEDELSTLEQIKAMLEGKC